MANNSCRLRPLLLSVLALGVLSAAGLPAARAPSAARQTAPTAPFFADLTGGSGIDPRVRYKYGAPMFADLNGDGWDDVVLGEHENGNARVYLRTSGKAFSLAYNHPLRIDYHGMAAFSFSGSGSALDVVMNQGGVNGGMLSAPDVFQNDPASGSFRRRPGFDFGISGFRSRGRAVLMIDVDLDGDDDMVLTGRTVGTADPLSEMAVLRNDGNGQWTVFDNIQVKNAFCYTAVVTIDIDDDNIMDIVCTERNRLSVLRGTGSFPEPFQDVTTQWLGGVARFNSFGYYDYMADLDYDNDGKMDLFMACGNNYTFFACDDVLLKNTGTQFVDVTAAAGIPTGGLTQQPATGDFNLDGYIDMLVPFYGGSDTVAQNLLLINLGDGTFQVSTSHGVNIPGPTSFRGAGAGAVLMNKAGKLDVIMGYEGNGTPGNLGGGPYKFYKNQTPKNGNNFLAFKVRDIPSKNLYARGAKVTVTVGGQTMTRRVGSAGGESQSFQRRVHFGIGKAARVESVVVKYLGGSMRTKRNLRKGFRSSSRK